MIIDEALDNIKQGYGIPHKHATLTTIIEYVKKAESCKDMGRYDPYTDSFVRDDCISRQAVMELPRYTTVIGEIVYLDGIKALPSVQPKAKSEWIPIKTRPLTEEEKAEMGTEYPYMYDCLLPDDGEEVEVTTYSGDVAMDIFCRDPEGCYFENYCDDGDVLAWRHKPEPYKAESEVDK